jgi:hypothetical protein
MIPKMPALGLDPRVDTGFRKRSCSNNKIERDDDSKKSHHALEALDDAQRRGFISISRIHRHLDIFQQQLRLRNSARTRPGGVERLPNGAPGCHQRYQQEGDGPHG